MRVLRIPTDSTLPSMSPIFTQSPISKGRSNRIVIDPNMLFTVSFAAEWSLGGREIRGALKVGLASLLGFLGGTLVKVLMAFTMVGVFLCAVFL